MISRFRPFIALLVAFVAFPAGLALAHETPVNARATLADAMCGSDMKTQADADKHTRACALMKHCAESGYGVFLDGAFHKFDAEGNRQAAEILKSSKNKDRLVVQVEGTQLHDGSIQVTKLTAQ
jgi:hypothetical protein